MIYVSESLMAHAWQKMGAMRTDQVLAMQKRHRKEQKTLAGFAYAQLLELREDAAGVGIYVFHAVVEAFSRVLPKPKAVRRPAIERAFGLSSATLAEEVRGAEPHAAQYLEEALLEEDEVILTDSERALCTHVVQAAILCLHEACAVRA